MKKFTLILLTAFSSLFTLSASTPYPVGELGAKWEFPSDHLPVGATVNDIHFVCWNILNTRYLNHIKDNEQGLKESLIMQANRPDPENPNLTLRESLIIQDILEMAGHPTHPRSLIALEEVGKPVFNELKKILPEHLELCPSDVKDIKHGDIFIYDTNHFDYLDMQTARYKIHPSNTYMILSLQEKETKTIYRFVQSHVPGGPVKGAPARNELAEALMNTFEPTAITLVMGDMNGAPELFLEAFEKSAEKRALPKHLFKSLPIPYPTIIDTKMHAAWIDNLFIAAPFVKTQTRVTKDGSELFFDLQPTLDLLDKIKPTSESDRDRAQSRQ